MKIIVVDDEKLALEGMMRDVSKVLPEADVKGFKDPLEVLSHFEVEKPDVAFLDIKMRKMGGIELAQKMIAIHPRLNVIFATGYDDYMAQAFHLYASGYVLKPVTEKAIIRELSHLRYPVEEPPKRQELFIQCFGNFEVFADKTPVTFAYRKTKEMLAYLVDRRGTLVSNGELIGILWEDEEGVDRHASYLQNMKQDLRQTLQSIGCEDILVRRRGRIGVAQDRINCDYYLWLKEGSRPYMGEYMSQYSWAEESRPGMED